MRKFLIITVMLLTALVLIAGCGGKGGKEITALQERADELYEGEDFAAAMLVYEKIYLVTDEEEIADAALDSRTKCEARLKLEKAQELANTGRQDEVATLVLEASEVFPEDVSVNYSIGWIYYKMAEEMLGQMQGYPPFQQMQIYLQAKAYMDLAKIRFERCIELDKDDFHGYKGMTIFYLADNKIEEAREAVLKGIELAKKDADVIEMRSLKAQILIGEDDMEKAKEEIDSLSEDYPDKGEIFYLIAQYHISQKEPDMDETLDTLKSGVKKEFDDEAVKAKMFALIGYLQNEDKEYEKARSNMLKALDIDPLQPEFLGAYPTIYAAYENAKSPEGLDAPEEILTDEEGQ